METATIQARVHDLQDQMAAIEGDADPRRAKRRVAEAARQLWLEMEDEGDLIDRYIYSPVEVNLIRVCVDLGLYVYLVKTQGSVSSNDIATTLGTDAVLMRRIMRCLAALGHVNEADVDHFSSNKFTRAFTTEKGICGAKFSFGFATPAWNAIPTHLKSINYRNPTDTNDTATQHGFASSSHFFELLSTYGAVKDFSKLMSSFRDGRAEFLEIYPFHERIVCGWTSEMSKLLVDVGGGRGHDIIKIVEQHPETACHVTLQDRPEVVEQAIRPDVMQVTAHDFFQPQPVKGARAYYMRMILHDWPDDQSITILKHLAAAMKPGYSRVLINDILMPEKGATRFMTQSDMAMMTFLAAMERDESQWRDLFDRAGLRVVGLWKATPESVFELELAEAP